MDLAQRMSQRMQRANVVHRAKADPLIGWASWHLSTAQMGWDLFRAALPNGDSNLTGHPFHTVELSAENLIFRGVVSAMDLCAGAIFRLSGQTLRADRERDVGWWLSNATRLAKAPVPQPLRDWLRVFDGNGTWELLTEIRDAFTHLGLRPSLHPELA